MDHFRWFVIVLMMFTTSKHVFSIKFKNYDICCSVNHLVPLFVLLKLNTILPLRQAFQGKFEKALKIT